MKKGDLIIVYKVYVGNVPEKNQEDYVTKIATELKSLTSDNVIEYFIPVVNEPEHPIEVIDTNNVQTNVLQLLENLLEEYYNAVKNNCHESKTN